MAPEYHLDKFRRAILTTTGVKVALRYRIINDNLPPQVTHIKPQIKAIHIEVNSEAPPLNHCECIGIAFSAKTQEFFTGIKMHLVAKTPTLTNPKAHHKTKQLQALQAHFLAQSDTCLL